MGGFAFLVGEEIGVGTLEIVDVAVIEVPDARGDFVEKVVVVGRDIREEFPMSKLDDAVKRYKELLRKQGYHP